MVFDFPKAIENDKDRTLFGGWIYKSLGRKVGHQYVFDENISLLFQVAIKQYCYRDIRVYYNKTTGEPYITEEEAYQSGFSWLSRKSTHLITWDQVAIIAKKCNNKEYENISDDNWQDFIKVTPYDIKQDYKTMERLMYSPLPPLVYQSDSYGTTVYFRETTEKECRFTMI